MKIIWIIVGAIPLLVISFFAGYMVRSQNCLTQTATSSIPVISPAPTAWPTRIQNPIPTTTLNLTPSPAEQPELELVFSNYNIAAVINGASAPTVFTTTTTKKIYSIQDYHWNNSQGTTPGTIALKSSAGDIFGPWEAEGAPGQGGVPNAYWTVYPNIEIPAGTYTVVDSEPSTWSQNASTNRAGMSQVYAVK